MELRQVSVEQLRPHVHHVHQRVRRHGCVDGAPGAGLQLELHKPCPRRRRREPARPAAVDAEGQPGVVASRPAGRHPSGTLRTGRDRP